MSDFVSYDNRADCFRSVGLTEWRSWLWQEQNAIRMSRQLRHVFPNLSDEVFERAVAWEKRGFRFLITPYVVSLMRKDGGGVPMVDDPVWRQVFPIFFENETVAASDEYSPEKENWEIAEEMVSPIAQHKYDNRIIIYISDVCLGYCLYCFRSLQSNADGEKHGGNLYWKQTLEAIRQRPRVEEVILSGGDPLIYDNSNLEAMLKDLRRIPTVKAIRIHTRAWTHNPFRIDEAFCRLLKQYHVTEMGVHVIHPSELTQDFVDAVDRIRVSGARTILLTDTPLVRDVNDDAEVLRQLFMGLYTVGVKPYYLSHLTPNIPAAAQQRTSVRKGVELMNRLKRRISNPAMPEYIITHRTGKRTVPDQIEGTSDFVYTFDDAGFPLVRFKNWKGEWVEYLDAVS